MITSTHNTKIQWIRTLQGQAHARREAQAFVVEGVRLAEEALSAGWPAQLVLYTDDLSLRGREIVQAYAGQGAPMEEASQQVMKSASGTETPQGILLVLSIQALMFPSLPDFLLIADGVHDPGNLGTILRTAAAAGVQAALLPPGTADAFAPKVVRSSMGAHFRLPIFQPGWGEIREIVSDAGKQPLQVYLADAKGGISCYQADFRTPLALIMGGEAEGAGEEAAELATARVHIPMPGKIESLNAAVAAAILMFEVVRQRG